MARNPRSSGSNRENLEGVSVSGDTATTSLTVATTPSPRLQRLQTESAELLRQELLENDKAAEEGDESILLNESCDDRENDPDPEAATTSSAVVACLPAPPQASNPLDAESALRRTSSLVYYWNCMIHSLYPVILLLMVLALWPAGFFSLKHLLTETDSSFHHPLHGTLSSAAQQAIGRKFPTTVSNDPPLLVVMKLSPTNHSTTTISSSLAHNTYARDSSLGLVDYLQKQLHGMKDSPTDYGINNATAIEIHVDSYFGYRQSHLSLLARPFLSKDQQTTFLQLSYRLLPSKQSTVASDHSSSTTSPTSKSVLKAIMAALDTYYEVTPMDIHVGFTGIHYFSSDLRASTQQALKQMDIFVLPLALALVCGTLRFHTQGKSSCGASSSTTWNWWFLWILPLCGMISSVATWSIILDTLVAPRMQITQFTPSIMMSLTLGMGMDYALFLLARYLETSSACNDSNSASNTFDHIQIMLEQAGQVVVVSGTTLLATFLALVALPLPMVQSVGIGAAVAIASAIAMNLMVIPALLYTPLLGRRSSSDALNEEDTGIRQAVQTLSEPLLAPILEDSEDEIAPARIIQPQNSLWIWISRQVLHPYKSVIMFLVLLQLLGWPLAWQSHRLVATNLSFESIIPADAPSLQAYHWLVEGWGGPSALAPFRLLIDGSRTNTSMNTAHAFDLQHELVQVLRRNATTGAKYTGISMANNAAIPYAVYQAAKLCGSSVAPVGLEVALPVSPQSVSSCSIDALRCLNVLDKKVTSKDRMATYLTVELETISPFDQEGLAWLDETRRRIQTLNATSVLFDNVDVYLDGTAGIAHDAVQAVYQSFPRVLASTLLMVFVLLGAVFRSIIPPLRSVVSIVCTLTISYGLAVLVFQDGIWNCLHISAVHAAATEPELSWLVPIMSFSIMVGLALDYDVFLVTRVLEFRLEGYGHESSIAAGLDATGSIITAAGIIMAVSFGSLLLASKSPALDQWAFLLTTAVLLDTFVVRTLVVPALMGWTGSKYSWYPRALPVPVVYLLGFDGTDAASLGSTNNRLCGNGSNQQILTGDARDNSHRGIQRRDTAYFEALEEVEGQAVECQAVEGL